MATWTDVRRTVGALPETEEVSSRATVAWTVRGKSFAWERPLRTSDLLALGERAPNGAILGIRTQDLEAKEALLVMDPGVFFTTPHFDGYAAVLVVLERIARPVLRDVLVDSWLARAPRQVAERYLAGTPRLRRARRPAP